MGSECCQEAQHPFYNSSKSNFVTLKRRNGPSSLEVTSTKQTQIETLNTSSGSTASASPQTESETENRQRVAVVVNFEQIFDQYQSIGPVERQFELNRLIGYINAAEKQNKKERSFTNDYKLGKVLG